MSDTTTEGGVTLTLTEEAAVQVRQFFAAENLDERSGALRVSVMPGGCSGFEYTLEVDEDEPADDDYVLESQGPSRWGHSRRTASWCGRVRTSS